MSHLCSTFIGSNEVLWEDIFIPGFCFPSSFRVYDRQCTNHSCSKHVWQFLLRTLLETLFTIGLLNILSFLRCCIILGSVLTVILDFSQALQGFLPFSYQVLQCNCKLSMKCVCVCVCSCWSKKVEDCFTRLGIVFEHLWYCLLESCNSVICAHVRILAIKMTDKNSSPVIVRLYDGAPT